MTATHKTNRHSKKARPMVQRTPKEEATFDTKLQRYVMPIERISMRKPG